MNNEGGSRVSKQDLNDEVGRSCEAAGAAPGPIRFSADQGESLDKQEETVACLMISIVRSDHEL